MLTSANCRALWPSSSQACAPRAWAPPGSWRRLRRRRGSPRGGRRLTASPAPRRPCGASSALRWKLRRANLDALHDAEHPLIHFLGDALALFRRQALELPVGDESGETSRGESAARSICELLFRVVAGSRDGRSPAGPADAALERLAQASPRDGYGRHDRRPAESSASPARQAASHQPSPRLAAAARPPRPSRRSPRCVNPPTGGGGGGAGGAPAAIGAAVLPRGASLSRAGGGPAVLAETRSRPPRPAPAAQLDVVEQHRDFAERLGDLRRVHRCTVDRRAAGVGWRQLVAAAAARRPLRASPLAASGMSIRCSTRSLSCAVTSCMRWPSSPASRLGFALRPRSAAPRRCCGTRRASPRRAARPTAGRTRR